MERNINPAVYGYEGLPDIDSEFDGDGQGWGWNAGIHYQFTEALSVGLSYRSGIELDLDGNINLTFPNNIMQYPAISGESEINLPAQWFGGVAYTFNNFLLEVGGKYEEWSSYDVLQIHTEQPILGSYLPPIPKQWEDTWGVNCGVKYNLNENIALALGYIHEWNPVPDETFDPQIPSSDKNIYSMGFQKRKFIWDSLSFAITYMYETYNSRSKDNSVGAEFGETANGIYDQESHLIATSLNIAF